MFVCVKKWNFAFCLLILGGLQYLRKLPEGSWLNTSLIKNVSLAIGMEKKQTLHVRDIGNIEFNPVAKSQLEINSETWIKFQIGYILPLHPNFLIQYQTPKSILLQVKAGHPDDEIILLKDDPAESNIEKKFPIFRKKIEHQQWHKITLENLSRGFYFLKVVSKNELSISKLKLNVLSSRKHVDLAGQSTKNARHMGINPKAFATEEFLDDVDPIDVYHFKITTPSIINMSMGTVLKGNVLVKLMKLSGKKSTTNVPEVVYQAIITDSGRPDSGFSMPYIYGGVQIHEKELIFDSLLTSNSYVLSLQRITGQINYQLRVNTFQSKVSSLSKDSQLQFLTERGFIPSKQFSHHFNADLSTRNRGEFISLGKTNESLLDIRGFGDSAYSANRLPTAPKSGFLEALQKFDRDKVFLSGDIQVINWESVVASKCSTYNGNLGFISSPESIRQAIFAGYNIFSLSNNHARDCDETPESKMLIKDGGGGEISTSLNMTAISDKSPILWSGVSEDKKKNLISSRIFTKGKSDFKIAFSSIDLGRNRCERSNCYQDRFDIAQALAKEDADLRIVMLHSREWLSENSEDDNLRQLDKINSAMQLFIADFGIDIVYGSGPHSALPARIIKKKSGGRGVGFWSLGNFIHPNLIAKPHSMIGRVLVDMETKKPVQVQVIMIRTNKKSVVPYDFDPTQNLTSGLPWEIAIDPITNLKIGYFDLDTGLRRSKQIVSNNNAH